MTARPMGDLLTSSSRSTVVFRQTGQPIWRGSYDVDDERTKVGRPFGDGSARQARVVINGIRDTMFAWINKVGTIIDKGGKVHRLRWEHARTACAVLSLMDFATGTCEATYDMIAKAAGICRITAIRHMAILRESKWLDWVRRSESGKQAPNSYIFEISRLPFEAQVHLRQILKRQGVALESHPERKGSGPVPNRAQRLAERVAKGFAGTIERMTGRKRRDTLIDEAEFVRTEMAHFGDIPTSQWAAMRHPDDPDAQRAYNARLGIPFFVDPSIRNASDSGLVEQGQKD
ncbi:hypothetical protein [Novosphingobium album (ex Liu et al. 2023)]|uniref:Helix-turn-helix domain-containing protein n=1 Tax=Novosphingobium album (ex Liu et al. 2023) TaxID=3031130 RepID=A0ABT5WM35_9SPHN|nr:hypothetical protein [Novosphingobium album (ex Liu et al. 2023)]MDE8651090.1 hypothetical protein [Novosphingobium album (ex Liu et al. 2023)]